MATVNGNLRTFFKSDLTGRAPFIRFIPSGVRVKNNAVFAGAHKDVPVEADSGYFSLDLEETVGDDYYTIQLWYLDSAASYISVDYPDFKLYVPAAGGEIGDLIDTPLVAGEVWISPGGSEPPGSKSGDLLFDPITNDLFQIN